MQVRSPKTSPSKGELVADVVVDGKTSFPKTVCIVDERGKHVYRLVKTASGKYCMQK